MDDLGFTELEQEFSAHPKGMWVAGYAVIPPYKEQDAWRKRWPYANCLKAFFKKKSWSQLTYNFGLS